MNQNNENNFGNNTGNNFENKTMNGFENNGANNGQINYGGGYTPYEALPKQAGKGLSIAGFVLSLVSIASCCTNLTVVVFGTLIVGLVLSAVGMAKSRGSGKMNGLAVAGLVISIVHAVFWIVCVAAILALGAEFLEQFSQFAAQYGDYGTNL